MALFKFKSDREPQPTEEGNQQDPVPGVNWLLAIVFTAAPVAAVFIVLLPDFVPGWAWRAGGILFVLLLPLAAHAIMKSAVRTEISSIEARLSRMERRMGQVAARGDWNDDEDWDDYD